MWMLTFTVVLDYQGLLLLVILWIFFRFFLIQFFIQSDRPTQYQQTHSTLNEKKKKEKKKNGLMLF